MGRADLSRHRRSSPSETPPVPLPEAVSWVTSELSGHPHIPIVKAVNSIKNATTQRVQVHSIKLLGYALRDCHSLDGQNHPQGLKCSCISKDVTVRPICCLAVPILVAYLFDAPSATGGLVSGALRAVIAARNAGVPGFDKSIQDFVNRIAYWSSSPLSIMVLCEGEGNSFLRAAGDMSVVAAALADSQAREWVAMDSSHTTGALQLVCSIADLYVRVIAADGTEMSSVGAMKDSMFADAKGLGAINRNVLERACDASMKAAQDLINHVIRICSDPQQSNVDVYHEPVSRAVDCCRSVLRCAIIPRSCTVACAVAYISGIIFTAPFRGQQETVTSSLQDVLLNLDCFPPFSRLALLRAVMEAPAAKDAHSDLLFPSEARSKANRDVFSALASVVMSSDDMHLRFLAMDAIISCIRRRSPRKLTSQCREVALSLVNRRLHEPFPGITSQTRETIEALMETDGGGDAATDYWVKISNALLRTGWQSKAVYALLTPLLKRLGAFRIMQAEPDCQTLAMSAIGADSKMSKLVSDWLGSFWKALWVECQDPSDFNRRTNSPLISSLLHPHNKSLRDRTKEYVLPVFIKTGGPKGAKKIIESLLQYLSRAEQVGHASQLRGTVYVLSVARQVGGLTGSFADPAVRASLQEALWCSEEDIRSSALDLIASSKIPTQPISLEELNMIQVFLPSALMPGSSLSAQSRFRHSMRRFLERLAACRHAALDGCGGWWIRERKENHGGKRTDALETLRRDCFRRIERFYFSFVTGLISSMYPGADASRRANALDTLTLLVRNLGLQDLLANDRISSKAVVTGIAACLLDEWERPRRSALETIWALEQPLPGFDHIENAMELQEFALPLLDSARQNEVDSGASICRSIFQKYVLGVAEHDCRQLMGGAALPKEVPSLHALRFGKKTPLMELSVTKSPALFYVESVLDSLDTLIERSRSNFVSMCRSGLFHGRCILLRLILQDFPWKEYCNSHLNETISFVCRVVGSLSKCAEIALRGVSFDSYHSHEHPSCSTHKLDGDDSIFLSEEDQYVRTACFLSLKEVCVSCGILGNEAPLTGSAVSAREEKCVLTMEQISTLAELLLLVFTSTRHWGVIDGAAEGLQLICERLLQAPSAELRALPTTWIRKTLSSALSGDFYVLRRSAGVPALISSILSAEASNHRRYHETPLLHTVMTTLLGHLERSHMFTDERILSNHRSRDEEAVAHALNLLRTLFLNGDLASSVLRYFESAVMCCIRAFCSVSWLIRNSTMMLFSALVRRGIGVCTERKPDTPNDGTSPALALGQRRRNLTAAQFFTRYPRLHPFLLQNLELAVSEAVQRKHEDHPNMFPILYILSSFSLSSFEDPSMRISFSRFRVVLKECIHWRSEYIRRAAAVAFALLIESSSQVVVFVQELVSGLPTEPQGSILRLDHYSQHSEFRDRHETSACGDSAVLRQNNVHGELLTVTAVLKGTRRIMALEDRISTIKALAVDLPTRTWIASDGLKNRCPATRAAMIVFLSEVFELAHQRHGALRLSKEDSKHASRLAHVCASAAISAQGGDQYRIASDRDVADVVYRKSVTRLLGLVSITFFRTEAWTFELSLDTLAKNVFSSHRESVKYGLRHLRELFDLCLPSIDARVLRTQSLSTTMNNVLRRSCELIKENSAQELAVEALCLLQSVLQFKSGVFMKLSTSGINLLGLASGSLINMAKGDPCIDVREQAIALLGYDVALNGRNEELLSEWIALLEEEVALQGLASSRIAVCASIKNSEIGLLSARETRFTQEVCVRALLVIVHLLEDSNMEVRASARDVFWSFEELGSPRQETKQDVLPSLMTIFEVLGTSCGTSDVLFQYMSSLLGIEKTRGAKCADDKLLKHLQLYAGSHKIYETKGAVEGLDAEGISSTSSSRLFSLEDYLPEGERVLHMQLIAWCFQKIILNHVPFQASVRLAYDICNSLLKEVRNGISDGSRPSTQKKADLMGHTFSVEGFHVCFKSVLRLCLGISCMLAAGTQTSTSTQLLTEIGKEIRLLWRQFGNDLHPAISSAMLGLHDMTCTSIEFQQNKASQAVFFLLAIPPTTAENGATER